MPAHDVFDAPRRHTGVTPHIYHLSMNKQSRVMARQEATQADVEDIARSVLRVCGVPFTSVAIAQLSAGWKVLVYDGTSLMLRLPILAGPPTSVRQAIVDAVEAVW
jgi:hypothetical protein